MIDHDRSPRRAVVLTPLRIEALALRRGGARDVVRTGMGPRRARAAARRVAALRPSAVAVAGVCGALDPALEAGDVVIASSLVGVGPLAHANDLAAHVTAAGLHARTGPLLSTARPLRGDRRVDAIAVDMESAWLAAAAEGCPLVVVRVVVDTPSRGLLNPLATVPGGVRALRVLRALASPLLAWAAAVGENHPMVERTGEPCPSP